MKTFAVLIFTAAVLPAWGAEVTIPTETFAFNTPYHKTVGSLAVSLPQGWTHTEHNETHYVVGGKDVYGTLTFAYNELGIMNFTSQFGTPTPPSTEFGDVKVYNQIKDGSATFLRDLGDGWSLRASLNSYPAFEGKDMTTYAAAMAEFLAKADVTLPDQDTVAAVDGAITMEFQGEEFVFKPESGIWTYSSGVLTHESGTKFTPQGIIDNEGHSYMSLFEKNTGIAPEIWAQFSMPQVIGSVADGKTHAMAKMRYTTQGDAFILLSGEGEADENLKEALIEFLQSRVQ